MKEKIRMFWYCKILKFHTWTSAQQEGVKATKDQLDRGVEGFKEYAKMYCSECGHESKYNLK